MDKFDRDLDEILNLTDTDESSSSSNPGVFESVQPFVLELHELKKDDPVTDKVTPEPKIKKKKKRAHPVTEKTSLTSSSDSIPTVTDTAGKEKFYDADESFYDLTVQDNQAQPAATVALAQAQSEHGQDGKIIPEATSKSERNSATPREPSKTITKPVVLPE